MFEKNFLNFPLGVFLDYRRVLSGTHTQFALLLRGSRRICYFFLQ